MMVIYQDNEELASYWMVWLKGQAEEEVQERAMSVKYSKMQELLRTNNSKIKHKTENHGENKPIYRLNNYIENNNNQPTTLLPTENRI